MDFLKIEEIEFFSTSKNFIITKDKDMLKRYLIYGLLGWNIEVIWTGFHSLLSGDWNMQGVTSLWMFFVYGLAVFVLEPIHDIIHHWRWPFRGVIWVVLIWGIEYASGLLLTEIIGVSPWYYTGRFAIDGLVRIDYAPAWFVAGLVFEWVHNRLDSYNIA